MTRIRTMKLNDISEDHEPQIWCECGCSKWLELNDLYQCALCDSIRVEYLVNQQLICILYVSLDYGNMPPLVCVI